MSQLREFQITLPSNASNKVYPANKPQSFRTELPTALNLEGDWEVALIDIQYPYKWKNIIADTELEIHFSKDPEKAELRPIGGLDLAEDDDGQPATFIRDEKTGLNLGPAHVMETSNVPSYIYKTIIPSGYYASLQAVCSKITKNFNRAARVKTNQNDTIRLFYDEINDRIRCANLTADWDIQIYFDPEAEIAKILALNTTIRFNEKAVIDVPFKTSRAPFFDRTSAVFIYSDIVQHQIVGDSLVQLLGVAPVKGNINEQYYWAFNPIMYRPLSKTYIKDIEIQLCGSDGRMIPIILGNTVVRLHFRKRQ